jgi:lipopolysaccharide/colanic/teichoic acid biosynthesis glycosyltransferase
MKRIVAVRSRLALMRAAPGGFESGYVGAGSLLRGANRRRSAAEQPPLTQLRGLTPGESQSDMEEDSASASRWASGKRAFDILVSLTLLIALLPALLLLAAAIKLDSKGPVFFKVPRVGHRGRPLMMLKFRKMQDAASGGPLTAERDPRLTRIGEALMKTRLDELPQLWDVLRGRMSIVGPRPEDPRFVALHPDDYDFILSVRPGITGLSQLAYAQESGIIDPTRPVEDYIERLVPQKLILDKLYATRSDLRLDLSILYWTIVAVLLRRPVAVSRRTGRMSVRHRPMAKPAYDEQRLRETPGSIHDGRGATLRTQRLSSADSSRTERGHRPYR